MRFTLNVAVPDRVEQTTFGRTVLSLPGVVSVFGVNDFVTVTRAPDADWDSIIAAVQHAAATEL